MQEIETAFLGRYIEKKVAHVVDFYESRYVGVKKKHNRTILHGLISSVILVLKMGHI